MIVTARSSASFSATIAAEMPEPTMQTSLSTTRRIAQPAPARGSGFPGDRSSGRQLIAPIRAR
jgi:hypothetical protein